MLFHYFHHPFWDTSIFGNTHIPPKTIQKVFILEIWTQFLPLCIMHFWVDTHKNQTPMTVTGDTQVTSLGRCVPPAARCDPPWERRRKRSFCRSFTFSLKGTRGGLVGWGEVGEKSGVKPKDGSFGKKIMRVSLIVFI